MATGLEALGAASAVLQVISFAGEIISVCKRVYDGKPTANDHLEEHAKRMSDAVNRVQSRCQAMAQVQPSGYDKKLDEIAGDCRTAAKELETEVRFVTGMHQKGSFLKAVNAMLRASSHRKKIERLELSLFRYRQLMETEMMSHLCSRSDAIELQQKQEFNGLATDVKSLVLQIAHGHTRLEDLVKAELDVTRQIIVQETAKTRGAINTHVTTEVQALGTNTATEAQRKSFLQSLKFPEINQRYNDLMNSRDASFKRVFASYEGMTIEDDESEWTQESDNTDSSTGIEDDESEWTQESDNTDSSTGKRGTNEIGQAWAEFVEWLQSSDSLFTIQGKPGSGKSTLVKFIIDNKTTKQLLSHWSSEVRIVSHFFWKIGSSPQSSIKGLLCSLVYRSLDGDQEMVEHVLDRFRHLSSNTYYYDWSTEALKTVLYFILEKDNRHQCVFIDGLDEICNRDGLFKLTQLIEEILKFPNIKMCVASRPETLVMSWLKKKSVPGVLLEDLTRPDMRSFVHKELKPFLSNNTISTNAHKDLTEKLVWKAQGVFLWLHLATRSVTTGIQNEDSEDMLLTRLEELPGELKQLYVDMWQRLNENNSIYRDTAARYFRYVLQGRGLITINPMFPKDDYLSIYPSIQQPVLLQLACAERVDIQDILLTGADTIDRTEVQRLCEETKLAIQNRSAGLLQIKSPKMGRSMTEILKGANGLDLPKGTEDVDDESFSRVDFIHRTAHDFLTDTETGQDILKFSVLSENGVHIRLLRGLHCAFRILHSEYGMVGGPEAILYEVVRLSEVQGDEALQGAIKMLHALENLYNKVSGSDRPLWQPKAPFLSHLTNHAHLDDFVILSLAQADSTALATDVLRDTWEPDDCLGGSGGSGPSGRLVEALISMGADPHVLGTNRKHIMGRMTPFERQGTAFMNLLSFGINSVVNGKYLGSDSAREMLKAAVSMAMICPDLSATTLVIGCVNGNGETWLEEVTRLGDPGIVVNAESPWLLYEVDFKFLLLRLLSGLAVKIDEDTLGGSKVDELLPRLENPSAKIRLIITRDEESEALICHRALSQLLAPEITERLFEGGADSRKKPEQIRASDSDTSAYECAMYLMRDPSMERVDFESAILSLADERLGFCTLLEAGIIPPLSYVERLETELSHYASTIEQLKSAASQNMSRP